VLLDNLCTLDQGPFKIKWNTGIVVASLIDAVVVALAGFWILFRLLLWKVVPVYCTSSYALPHKESAVYSSCAFYTCTQQHWKCKLLKLAATHHQQLEVACAVHCKTQHNHPIVCICMHTSAHANSCSCCGAFAVRITGWSGVVKTRLWCSHWYSCMLNGE
jgi:hypothetical protein